MPEECTCHEADHRTDCPEFISRQRRMREIVEAIDDLRARRGSGAKLFRGASHAVTWALRTGAAWSAPRAVPIEFESGAPSRGADQPARRAFAAVIVAMRAAFQDDVERHGDGAAPLAAWVRWHFLEGLSHERIALRYEGTANQDAWTGVVVDNRMRRFLRVVSDRLRERGWLEERDP